jgi:hypothetical protein
LSETSHSNQPETSWHEQPEGQAQLAESAIKFSGANAKTTTLLAAVRQRREGAVGRPKAMPR